jgi:hypothetical protein
MQMSDSHRRVLLVLPSANLDEVLRLLARTGKEEQKEFDAIVARSYGADECEGLVAARSSPWQYRRALL